MLDDRLPGHGRPLKIALALLFSACLLLVFYEAGSTNSALTIWPFSDLDRATDDKISDLVHIASNISYESGMNRVRAMQLEHSDGVCCPSHLKSLYKPKQQDCVFMLNSTVLRNSPNERTQLPDRDPICLLDNKWFARQGPLYSLILPIFNSGYRLRVVLVQLLKLTSGPWELLVNMDGATDDSLQIVHDVIAEYETWPMCPTSPDDLDTKQVWQTHRTGYGSFNVADGHTHLRFQQGELGTACRYFEKHSLVHFTVTYAPPPGLLATASNNIGMRSAFGKYLVLLDDDQIMTTPRWNEKLAAPFEKWADIFSLSMRCAHNYPVVGGLTGAKCTNTLALQTADSCQVFIRDSGNRGPLMIRYEHARQLGFLDEVNFMGFVTLYDDHDFNHRASCERGWVSGQYPIEFTEERCCRSTNTNGDLPKLKKWFFSRRAGYPETTRARHCPDYTTRSETRVLC